MEKRAFIYFVMAWLICQSGAGNAQQFRELNKSEQDSVIGILKKAEPPPAAMAPGQTPRPRELCRIVGFAGASLVEVLEFDYQNGVTRRSLVDAAAGTVKKQENLEAYPTPLSAAEIERATALARDKAPAVKALFATQAEKVRATHMCPVVEDPASPLFRHRIVHVTFRKPLENNKERRVRVTVDLSSDQVSDIQESVGRAEAELAPPPTPAAAAGAPGVIPSEGAQEETIEVYFPRGASPSLRKTGWKIRFGIEPHAGGGKILCIKEAFYKRGPNEPWFQITGDTRLAEIYVPYNDGVTAYYDIAGQGFQFGLQRLDDHDLGPVCLGQGRVHFDAVAEEYHDTNTLWMDAGGRSARGQSLSLWAVLAAGNYRYIMDYVFHDDGSIGLLLGPTAHNLKDSNDDRLTTHLHVGCWRISPVLGDAASVQVQHVKYISTSATGSNSRTEKALFNEGREGGIPIKPEEYTSVRLESTTVQNQHNPPHPVSFDLVIKGLGAARRFGANTEWTQQDFWVTRATGPAGEPLWRFNDVYRYASNRREMAHQPPIVWAHASLVHRVRDEDFGKEGFDSNAGVALANYFGIWLKPRNLHPSTPLFELTNGP